MLTRTNGEALKISGDLRLVGVEHVLRRALEDAGAVAWIATVFAGLDRQQLTADQVRASIAERTDIDPDEGWVALKTAEGDLRSRDSLSLYRLRRAVAARALPLELLTKDDGAVVVSTAAIGVKGLEFDRVVYVDRQRWHRGSDVQADVRVDYVALSRARDEILRTEASAWMRKDRRTRRWTARKRSRPDFAWAMETLAHDVEVAGPAGATSDAAREIQQCLG